ncbi:MAG TPA: hypothetical protein VLJ10_00720, partial [Candidatus Bathyarchaeia archaeon]|nr:hypothetical protein [Candidatus Bathyarchaeia archaeon]
MKRKTGIWFVFVFMAAVMLSLCSCGSTDNRSTGTIELNNNSVMAIDRFYLAPVDQMSWGPNLLAGQLFPDGYASIINIYPDFYDAKIRAPGAYSDYFGYLYDIPVTADGYLRLYVHNFSFTGSLEIRNNTSGASIREVYVVPADAPTWGANQTSSVIRPSELLHLTDFAPG